MIDWGITKNKIGVDEKYFINYPGSHKKIYRICDQCGKGKWIRYKYCSKLCLKCSRNGKNNYFYNKHPNKELNPFYGKHHTNETKEKLSINHRGELGNNYGKKFSDETKSKMSKKQMGKNNSMYGRSSEKSPNWKGGLPLRDHLKNEKDCIHLNKRFEGSHGHHITSGVVIFIPCDLHKSIYHNMKTNKNMNKINKIAWYYLLNKP